MRKILQIVSSSWNAGLLQADSFFRLKTELPAFSLLEGFLLIRIFLNKLSLPFPLLLFTAQQLLQQTLNGQIPQYVETLLSYWQLLEIKHRQKPCSCPIHFLCKTLILKSHYLNLIYFQPHCSFLSHSCSLNTITKFILCFSIFKRHSRWKCNWILILTFYFSQAGINFHRLNLYQKP